MQSENRALVLQKPESKNYVLIRDIIYHHKSRGDTPKIIQDVGMFSCLLCFYAVICTKEDEMNWHQYKFLLVKK